jgi:hypothetical protein
MTSKLYRLVTSVIDACAHFNFIWQNHALPKVKFFAWLLLQEHIQCKSNLKKKNILDTDVCELCNQSAETTSHLISGCSFAQRFWRHLGWEPLIIPPAADLWKIQAQAGAPTRSLPTMVLLCCWNLWIQRSRRTLALVLASFPAWRCRVLEKSIFHVNLSPLASA